MPTLTWNESSGEYRWIGGYESKDLPKQAGFRWDPNCRRWWTRAADRAVRLVEYADDAARTALRPVQAALAASRSTGTEPVTPASPEAPAAPLDEIPCPAGLAYLPFQQAGIRYAMGRPSTLIADEMGLGKSIESIGVFNADPTIRNVLVVCPASLRLNWGREWAKWAARPAQIRVCLDSSPVTAADEVVIVNDERLKGESGKALRESILAREWDLLIVDEAHRLKNPRAQRTQLVLGTPGRKGALRTPGLLDRCKRRVLLTGTPLVNRPIELWPILSAVAPHEFNNFFSFAKRYADAREEWVGHGRFAKKVWKFDGASHLDELQNRMRATCMVRRLKRDVLADLPAKRRQIVVLAPNGAASAIRHELDRATELEEQQIEARARLALAEANDDPVAYEEAARALREAAQVAFTEISKVRHETAVAKIPAVVGYIDDALETLDSRKVVVFAHHHDVIDGIIEGLGPERCVRIMGNDSPEVRDAAVRRFQNDPACEVIVGSIGAMGVGLTLTAASTVIFAELDWVPGNVTQAEDRCHRIGQTVPVNVIHLVFDGSLDARMVEILIEKQAIARLARRPHGGDPDREAGHRRQGARPRPRRPADAHDGGGARVGGSGCA